MTLHIFRTELYYIFEWNFHQFVLIELIFNFYMTSTYFLHGKSLERIRHVKKDLNVFQ